MVFQYMINKSAPHNPAELRFQTMRVAALDEEILKAKVDNYLKNGFELATDEQVIADRGALLEDTEAGIKDMETQEINNGNTSAEAVEANAEIGNQGQEEESEDSKSGDAESEDADSVDTDGGEVVDEEAPAAE